MSKLSHAVVRSFVALSIVLVLGSCMTVTDKHTIVQSGTRADFTNKKIAVLPVKVQASLAPDSIAGLRADLNRRLAPSLRSKLPSAQISDVPSVADQLNQRGALPVFEQLLGTYENTGVIDRRQSAALGQALGSEYLLVSRLKAEKMDIVISRGMGASLELMLVAASTGEIVWGGTGEWKRGGIYGFGKSSSDEAAESLVKLAFDSLRSAGGATVASADEQQRVRKTEPPLDAASDSRPEQAKSIPSRQASDPEGSFVVIKKSYPTVNVRSDPSVNKVPVAKLRGGDKVETVGENGDWLKIRFNTQGHRGEGWIRKDLVEK